MPSFCMALRDFFSLRLCLGLPSAGKERDGETRVSPRPRGRERDGETLRGRGP